MPVVEQPIISLEAVVNRRWPRVFRWPSVVGAEHCGTRLVHKLHDEPTVRFRRAERKRAAVTVKDHSRRPLKVRLPLRVAWVPRAAATTRRSRPCRWPKPRASVRGNGVVRTANVARDIRQPDRHDANGRVRKETQRTIRPRDVHRRCTQHAHGSFERHCPSRMAARRALRAAEHRRYGSTRKTRQASAAKSLTTVWRNGIIRSCALIAIHILSLPIALKWHFYITRFGVY